jgi:hypothetical protein
MKTIILSTLMLLAFISNSQAFDKTGKTAVGLTGGKVFIVGGEKFNSEADGLWAYGAYARHHFDPNWGMDVAITRQDYDKICSCTRSNIFDVLGFYRVKGAEDLTPVVGLGLGAVDNGKAQNLHLGVRARVGMEKAMSEKVSLGAHIDYQAVTKMIGAKNGPRPGDIGTFTPKLEVTWYFGN